MNIPLSAFAPENLVSQDGFGSPVPRLSKNDRTKGRGFNQSINAKTKRNKRDTRERRHGICKPNARRIQVIAPPPASQQCRANQHEPAFFGGYPLFSSSRHVWTCSCSLKGVFVMFVAHFHRSISSLSVFFSYWHNPMAVEGILVLF